MDKQIELLPCPFCGEQACQWYNRDKGEYVGCTGCNVQTDGYGHPDKAIKDWNTRTSESACGDWVRIETDGLPTDTNVYLVSVDWYNDSRSTDFASYRDRHWWSERSDGYGEPIKLCDYGRVIAWREMPEPIADNEGGEND